MHPHHRIGLVTEQLLYSGAFKSFIVNFWALMDRCFEQNVSPRVIQNVAQAEAAVAGWSVADIKSAGPTSFTMNLR